MTSEQTLHLSYLASTSPIIIMAATALPSIISATTSSSAAPPQQQQNQLPDLFGDLLVRALLSHQENSARLASRTERLRADIASRGGSSATATTLNSFVVDSLRPGGRGGAAALPSSYYAAAPAAFSFPAFDPLPPVDDAYFARILPPDPPPTPSSFIGSRAYNLTVLPLAVFVLLWIILTNTWPAFDAHFGYSAIFSGQSKRIRELEEERMRRMQLGSESDSEDGSEDGHQPRPAEPSNDAGSIASMLGSVAFAGLLALVPGLSTILSLLAGFIWGLVLLAENLLRHGLRYALWRNPVLNWIGENSLSAFQSFQERRVEYSDLASARLLDLRYNSVTDRCRRETSRAGRAIERNALRFVLLLAFSPSLLNFTSRMLPSDPLFAPPGGAQVDLLQSGYALPDWMRREWQPDGSNAHTDPERFPLRAYASVSTDATAATAEAKTFYDFPTGESHAEFASAGAVEPAASARHGNPNDRSEHGIWWSEQPGVEYDAADDRWIITRGRQSSTLALRTARAQKTTTTTTLTMTSTEILTTTATVTATVTESHQIREHHHTAEDDQHAAAVTRIWTREPGTDQNRWCNRCTATHAWEAYR